jgi:hypothetical protein
MAEHIGGCAVALERSIDAKSARMEGGCYSTRDVSDSAYSQQVGVTDKNVGNYEAQERCFR